MSSTLAKKKLENYFELNLNQEKNSKIILSSNSVKKKLKIFMSSILAKKKKLNLFLAQILVKKNYKKFVAQF